MSQPAAETAVARQPPPGRPDPDLPLRPRPVWSVLFAVLMVFQAYVIFVQEHGTVDTSGHDTRPVGEVAGQVTIRQNFKMEAGGLDRISVRAQPSGREHEGPVIFELAEAGTDPSGDADVPIYRNVVETRRVVDDRTFTWRFTPLDDSNGKTYALRISMPAAPFDRGLTLLATRDEHPGGGGLWFDGRELWGDLVLETSAVRATAFRRFEHALRDKPWWLRSRVTLGLFFVLYNLALGAVLWAVLTAPDEDAEAGERIDAPVDGTIASRPEAGTAEVSDVGAGVGGGAGTSSGAAAGPGGSAEAGSAAAVGAMSRRPPGQASPRARAAGLGALIVICGFAAYVMYEPRVHIEPGARELVADFPETAKRTTMPSLDEGFLYDSVSWKGRRMHCIVALPSSRINWTVDVKAGSVVRGWYGMRPDAWQGHGDGSTFRLGISDSGKYVEKVKRNLYPDMEVRDRVFVPIRVDLAEYAGRRIEVVLNTEPNFIAVGDAAMWCEVRVVKRE